MLINTVEAFHESLTKFTDTMVTDTETTGLEIWYGSKQCGIGVCTSNEETFYYPFRHKDDNFPLLFNLDGPLNLQMELLPILLDKLRECKTLIFHNAKFDMTILWQDGFTWPREMSIEDTMVAARLFFPDKRDSLALEDVVEGLFPHERANQWKTEFKEYLRKSKSKTYDMAHPVIMAEYCERDCLMTWRARGVLIKYIEETEQTRVWEQEKELTPVVWDMEREGLYFDRAYAVEKIAQLEARCIVLEQEIRATLGPINIASQPQLTKAMNDLGIYSPSKTKGKKQSWDSDALIKLGHPIGAKLLEYRSFQKMLGTYLRPLLSHADDRLHPRLNQAGAISGRFSCSNPNLQNLINGAFLINTAGVDLTNKEALAATVMGGAEIKDEFAGLMPVPFTGSNNEVSIKRLFIPPPGYKMWLFDFSQMEMRVFADYIQDPTMNELLENRGFDFHDFVAQTVWGAQPGTPLWKFYRKLAKNINFGLIFCVGNEKLGLKIQKTTEEAGQYKFDYFRRFPNANAFIQKVINTVQTRGYVFNRWGRKYFIEKDRAYVGINYLVQGTSAEIVKNCMIACWKYLKDNNLKSRMVIQVHDELGFYIADEEESFVPRKLKEIIEERQIKTFLPVSAERANPSWMQKQPMCVKCVQPLTKEEDAGTVVHPCDEPATHRRVQVKEENVIQGT